MLNIPYFMIINIIIDKRQILESEAEHIGTEHLLQTVSLAWNDLTMYKVDIFTLHFF